MISIVIPARNDDVRVFSRTLASIENQIQKPNEVILIDSSSNDDIKKIFEDTDLGNVPKVYKKIPPAFAGKSTNLGIKLASSDFIGLLDTKTIPDKGWISDYLKYL